MPAASPVSSGSATQRSGKKASFERNKPGLARSRKASAKKFEGNVNKRGLVNPKRDGEQEEGLSLNKYVVGFLIFLVLGSAIFQIISQATSSSPL